jgi:hypothetical protein
MTQLPLFHGALDTIAYIDAGAGSMLLQAAAAGILTGAFFIKNQWKAIKALASNAISKRNAK